MPPKKQARLGYDKNGVFVYSEVTDFQIPKNARVALVHWSVRVLGLKFNGCLSLMEVTLQEGIHTIDCNAFQCCRFLTIVKFPSTLREIRHFAFAECHSLTSIKLQMGLKMIGHAAFGNTGLRHLEVPATVGTIGSRAFARCGKLESLILPPKLEVITCELFESCSLLDEIEIPRTVKAIEQSAFENCEALEELDLLHCTQCLAIEKSAFKSCYGLSWITLPPNLEGTIEEGTFEGCSRLTHFRVSMNVTNIGGLEDCESLLSLEVPEEVEGIQLNIVDYDGGNIDDGWGGFQEATLECSSLVNFYLPPSAPAPALDRILNVPIPESFHLAKVARDWGDLVAKLKQRFDGLPLHKVCYFHSYHPDSSSEKHSGGQPKHCPAGGCVWNDSGAYLGTGSNTKSGAPSRASHFG